MSVCARYCVLIVANWHRGHPLSSYKTALRSESHAHFRTFARTINCVSERESCFRWNSKFTSMLQRYRRQWDDILAVLFVVVIYLLFSNAAFYDELNWEFYSTCDKVVESRIDSSCGISHFIIVSWVVNIFPVYCLFLFCSFKNVHSFRSCSKNVRFRNIFLHVSKERDSL